MGEALPSPDSASRAAVAARARHVLRPQGALRRLDELAAWLAGWQGRVPPSADRATALVFAADHGVVQEGVTPYPASVTAEVVTALRAGAATAAVMARHLGADLRVVDVGVGHPTRNLAREPALTSARFEQAWQAGRDAVATVDADVLVVGEVGMGNTTAAAAVAAALCGGPVEQWVGRGSGADDTVLARKLDAVARGCDRVAGAAPLDVLRQVGGAELVAMAGAIATSRGRRLPVLLDGFVVTAAAAALELHRPGALDHCLAAHVSSEPGHARLLERLDKQPLLDLDLRLGEGSGALAALPLLRLAVASVCEVATFEEWGLHG